MKTIHDLLDEYARLAPDTRTKGLYLEKLTKRFLTVDPVWTDRFEQVWLWSEWPDRDGKVDTGIDLVAKERFGDGVWAIQCKFFDPKHTIQKPDIDSFFTASGKHPFTNRMLVSTTDKWSSHAEDALKNQRLETVRLGVDDFAKADLYWDAVTIERPDELRRAPAKSLRPHQVEALQHVEAGFAEHDRGKLIMACGTGKTFTSLRIAEKVAGQGGSVLFLVPSIALLSQTLREWSAERAAPIRAFAVCSDTKVGKDAEDYSISDLAYPATTDSTSLLKQLAQADPAQAMTVYFSTYQSIDVVAAAQRAGVGEFDLVICDEAHRTSGFTAAGADESAFLRVHSESAIRTKKRLYMTATPKIYGENARAKANDAAVVLTSMDDESIFGPVFHRLGFGEAVERGLLTDYRVVVLAVDEGAVTRDFQIPLSTNGELNIPDAARLVGIYNGLAKRGRNFDGTADALKPLRRAVVFARSIARSKQVQSLLDGYEGQRDQTHTLLEPRIDEVASGKERAFRLEADHVDGTMNVLERNRRLEWLKERVNEDDNACRILTNARCLSEGVDVPALDAVIFLDSRDSQIDVVQSVGRVMRRSEGKDYGYIVLPIAVPAGLSPEQALNDNSKFKVIWDVLRALRAHDERFEAKIEQISLNGSASGPVLVESVPSNHAERPFGDTVTPKIEQPTSMQLDWAQLGDEWQHAIYAKVVDKVGERDYWENWAKDVADIAGRHRDRLKLLVHDGDPQIAAEFRRFLKGLQDNLNPAIDEDDGIEMLSQHLITQPVFDALFSGSAFTDSNPVARVMQRMVDALEGKNLESETRDLEGLYASVRRSVEGISDPAGRQELIKRLYEKFFTGAFRDTSNRLGIVYTPNEIVDFILRSADDLSREHFGVGLTGEGVHILDPFTGTGTFVVRLLQSGLIEAKDLARKFRYELHANELVLLAYYVAAVNIEATYNALAPGERYRAFPGIVLTDTFQSSEEGDALDDGGVFGDNNERVKQQNSIDVRVIVGNPPYSSGQDSANENNQNLKYPFLDARIAATYAAHSTATLKNSLYDSYIRAIRWASDRIKDCGIVAFVTNGGYIDGNTADGLRKTLVKEFTEIYVLNLRGNTRTSGEQARREGGQTFGPGSRATIAITILVKNPDRAPNGVIHYQDIGDYLSREEKLARLQGWGSSDAVPWEDLLANEHGDWINQRNDTFSSFAPIGDKTSPRGCIFSTYSAGLKTNRDAWVYNSSRLALGDNVSRMIQFYNGQVDAFAKSGGSTDDFGNTVNLDAASFSWDRADRPRLIRGHHYSYDQSKITTALYRPFNRQQVYFDRELNNTVYQLPRIFPRGAKNFGFVITSPASHYPTFEALMVDALPDLHLLDTGQFFPRYTYDVPSAAPSLFDETDLVRVDNISPETVARYRELYGEQVTSDDVFFFVYGLLHCRDYREEFAGDLKKMLPRLPELSDPADFWAFAHAGGNLSGLHLGYESAPLFPLDVIGEVPADLYVTKMRFGGKQGAWDKSQIRITESLALSGIPRQAYEYMLGSRSAIEWVMERYQVKTDKASGIVNDPNQWGREHSDPRYILELLLRIVTVSVETVKIVESLPPLRYMTETARETAETPGAADATRGPERTAGSAGPS